MTQMFLPYIYYSICLFSVFVPMFIFGIFFQKARFYSYLSIVQICRKYKSDISVLILSSVLSITLFAIVDITSMKVEDFLTIVGYTGMQFFILAGYYCSNVKRSL